MTRLTHAEVLRRIDCIQAEMAAEFEALWHYPESKAIAAAVQQVDWLHEEALRRRALGQRWPDTYTYATASPLWAAQPQEKA